MNLPVVAALNEEYLQSLRKLTKDQLSADPAGLSLLGPSNQTVQL